MSNLFTMSTLPKIQKTDTSKKVFLALDMEVPIFVDGPTFLYIGGPFVLHSDEGSFSWDKVS